MRFSLIILFAPLLLLDACSNGPEWINIGERIVLAEKAGEVEIAKIPYRLYNFKSIKKNIDIVDLTLQTQPGEAIDKEVMIAVRHCFAPGVIHGIPAVLCSCESLGDIYISGNNEVRSKLLHIKDDQNASLIGRIIGIHAASPVVQVL